MKRYTLHDPFSIYHFETDVWAHSVHKHTYFEIIFILRGCGVHRINNNVFPYTAGDVFLLGPEDFHHFEIEETTEFSFVRFNAFSDDGQPHDKDRPWEPVIKALLGSSSQSRGSIVTEKSEREKLHHLLHVLEAESAADVQYYEIVRDSLMRSMLVILARNLFGHAPGKPLMKDSIEAILLYIKQHIHTPQRLTIEHLADTFSYAPTYISLFFKSQTGESLKQYIGKYKIKLIEARLLYSELTLKEIAEEFGFTDESHLCKHFRKHTGTTPTRFRNGTGG